VESLYPLLTEYLKIIIKNIRMVHRQKRKLNITTQVKNKAELVDSAFYTQQNMTQEMAWDNRV